MNGYVEKLAHELADAVINPDGYADEAAESDRRAERRDALEVALLKTVREAVEEE